MAVLELAETLATRGPAESEDLSHVAFVVPFGRSAIRGVAEFF